MVHRGFPEIFSSSSTQSDHNDHQWSMIMQNDIDGEEEVEDYDDNDDEEKDK